MIDERVLLAVAIRGVLMGAALVNLRGAYRDYRQHHGDARGLRGFVAAVTMLAGALAVSASSPALREAFPTLERGMSLVAIASTAAFCIGVIFSAWTWRQGRNR